MSSQSLQSIVIAGYKSGAVKNKKPFLINDDAFVNLFNAYCYREEIRKREGLQLIGRYRRVLTAQAQTAADGTVNYSIADILSAVRMTEANAELQPGSIVIIVDSGGGNETQFTDQGNGLFTRTSGSAYQIDTGTFVNYTDGSLTVVWTGGGTPPNLTTIHLDYNYYPALPAMGISVREIPGINAEQTMWFDTKYCYIHDGSEFQEYLPAEAVTWNGSDSDFFWTTNYRGSEAQTKLFFETNFVNSSGSPMRYTDGSTWEDFNPIVSGTSQTEVQTTALASGSAAYGPYNLTNFPIIEGTVVVTVSENPGTETSLVFRDTQKDGTLQAAGSNTGTIDYSTGAISLSFSPNLPGVGPWTVSTTYDQGTNYLFTSRILIPYYGRLVAINCYEGIDNASAVNISGRARYSQLGSPVAQDAWRSDVFGKGGFIDAPTNEDAIGATFYKNTLIVGFERSTWRLQYVGEYGTPFIWERISSDFGTESTFSPVLFDSGVLSVGDKAIVGSSGTDVQRIDLDIPDTVYLFRNADNGVKRVHGIRDFRKEVVYWCFPNYQDLQTNQYFPDKTLLYNYRNNTWAFFRNNVTCYGNFKYPANITWDRLDVYWDDWNVTWDSGIQENYPAIACANQQGFAHFYGYPDAETSVDSTISANDQESLAVKSVTVTTVVNLEIPNHNLVTDEVIYLTGLIYTDTDNSLDGSTTLNDQIYFVKFVDKDNIEIGLFDQVTKEIDYGFSVTNVGTYLGGGVVALFPKLDILTKDFNPAKQAGLNVKTSYVDFLFDTSSIAPIQVLMMMNTNSNNIGNMIIGNQNVETSNHKSGFIQGVTLSNPLVIKSINHGLGNGAEITIQGIVGTTELNGNTYTVTFIDVDHFSLGVDGTVGYTTWVSGGYWIQTNDSFWSLSANYSWHRFLATCFGQYFAINLTYSMEQMSQLTTHQQNFVLNAMQIYYRPGGKNIFGKN